MTLEQAHSLEEIFAEYKGSELGWVIPKWLVELKMNIIIRNMEDDLQSTLDQPTK